MILCQVNKKERLVAKSRKVSKIEIERKLQNMKKNLIRTPRQVTAAKQHHTILQLNCGKDLCCL